MKPLRALPLYGRKLYSYMENGLVNYWATLMESGLGVGGVRPQHSQRGASAAGDTPLRTHDSTPTPWLRRAQASWGVVCIYHHRTRDSIVIQPRLNVNSYFNLIVIKPFFIEHAR